LKQFDYFEESFSEDQLLKWIESNALSSISDMQLANIVAHGGYYEEGDNQLCDQVLTYIDTMDGINVRPIELSARYKILIKACFELARRKLYPTPNRIDSALDIYRRVFHYADRQEENVILFCINGAQEVITTHLVARGAVNGLVIHPREIFSLALKDRAIAIILAHNHPSGNTNPSSEDVLFTKRISEAGTLLGIPLMDHIVFGHTDFYSFEENDML
jgi:DNA repair protein RadC